VSRRSVGVVGQTLVVPGERWSCGEVMPHTLPDDAFRS
jgi:hypothetical protein